MSSRCFRQSRGYATFGEATHRFMTIQKRNATKIRFFANIMARSKNFEMKIFYRLKDNSYLHMMARFHQNISSGAEVVPLLVRPPTVL
jgi:hypothetical protein